MNSTSSAAFSSGAKVSEAARVTDAAWQALQGGYDLQVHVAPDVIERRIDDLDLAKEFLARGLRGFVLKSHYFPTAERAAVVSRAIAEFPPMERCAQPFRGRAQPCCSRTSRPLRMQNCVDAHGGRSQ